MENLIDIMQLSTQEIDELVKKGELTVEQGKVLNEELKHNIKDAIRENVTLHVVTPEQTFRGSPSSFLR